MTDAFYAGGGIGLGPAAPVAEREPYPAPEVSSRDGVAGPVKKAVTDLQRYAEAHGWTVLVTYARGCPPHATTGRPLEPTDSLAVRMVRGMERAVAVYAGRSTWSWASLWLLSPERKPTAHASLATFKAAIGSTLTPCASPTGSVTI